MLSRFEVRDSYVQWIPVSSARTQTDSCSYAVATHRRVIKTIVTLLFPSASAYICNTLPRAGPSHHSTGLSISKSPVNDYSLCVTTADQIRDRTTPGTFLSTTGAIQLYAVETELPHGCRVNSDVTQLRLNMEQSSYAKACWPRRPVRAVRTGETEAFNSYIRKG